jgi:putative GTP pyrophosphokinase
MGPPNCLCVFPKLFSAIELTIGVLCKRTVAMQLVNTAHPSLSDGETMAFPHPEYSRSQVNKAGAVLAKGYVAGSNFTEYIHAYEIVNNWRSCHSYPINTFQITLRNKVKPNCPNFIVAQRLKRLESITAKLSRYPHMKLSTMQDIGGLRAIVQTASQAAELRDTYVRMTHPIFLHELVSHKDYLVHPKDSGYRSIHLVYKYQNPRAPEYDGLQLELQIRSKLQHLWATAVETVGTFLKHSLKASQGPSEWLDFFALTGSAFAHIEKLPRVPQYSALKAIDTYAETLRRANELRVKEHLESYTAVAEHIKESGRKHAYHLIVLDPIARKVTVRPFSKGHLYLANEEYLKVEKEISGGAPLQAVLVSAGTIAELRRAYPNYFLDTHEFLAKLYSLGGK